MTVYLPTIINKELISLTAYVLYIIFLRIFVKFIKGENEAFTPPLL